MCERAGYQRRDPLAKKLRMYPDSNSASYVTCMEAEKMPEDMAAFEKRMDEGLRSRLIQYDTYRGKLLNPCRVVLMRAGWADD